MNFSRTKYYLQFLNAPAALADRLGMTAPRLRWMLQAQSAMARRGLEVRMEVLRRARYLMQQHRNTPGENLEWELMALAKSVREEGQLLRGYAQFQAGLHGLFKRLEAIQAVPPPPGGALTMGQAEELERQVQTTLAPVLPSEQALARLHRRLRVCPLCKSAFLRAPEKRAQRYCLRCHKRWSKQQLWYRAKQKGGGEHGSTTRTR